MLGNPFFDPVTQGLLTAGGSMLASSGPSMTPQSLGSVAGKGMLAGMQGYGQAVQNQRNEVLTQLQLAKLKREIQAQEAFAGLFGPQGAPSAAAGGSAPVGISEGSANAVGAPWANSATLPQPATQPQKPFGPSIEQLGPLMALDPVRGKGLVEWWKAANPAPKFEGGVARHGQTGMPLPGVPVAPQTNQQGFSTTPWFNHQTGQFEVRLTPGGTDAFTAQQDISEAAKARRDPFMGVQDAEGRTIPMTREDFASTYGGVRAPGQAPVPQAPQQPSQADVVGFAPTEADALSRVRAAAKNGLTATYRVDPAKAGGMGPTTGQKTTATTIAEGDAKRVLDLEAKLPSLLSVQRRLDRMEMLTKDDRTYAAAGAELKSMLGSIAQSLGLNVAKDKTANTEEYLTNVAELLKDRLASKDYGSGSGVSNLDLLTASKPLPELARTTQGRMQIISALKTDAQRAVKDAQAARDFFDSNNSLRSFRYPSEIEFEEQRRRVDLPKDPATQAPRIPAGVKVTPIRR